MKTYRYTYSTGGGQNPGSQWVIYSFLMTGTLHYPVTENMGIKAKDQNIQCYSDCITVFRQGEIYIYINLYNNINTRIV